jgi:hypothetical protein
MTDVHRCIIVPSSLADDARAMAAAASPGGAGMFTSALSADGSEPATFYISSGPIDPEFAEWLESPEALSAKTTEKFGPGGGLTLEQAEQWFSACDVSEDDWQTACARVGVQPVQGDDE